MEVTKQEPSGQNINVTVRALKECLCTKPSQPSA
jgi:hypothetical protein